MHVCANCYVTRQKLTRNKVKTKMLPMRKEACPPLVRLWRYTADVSTQRTMIVNNIFRRSHSVNNNYGLTPYTARGRPEAVLIFEHVFI